MGRITAVTPFLLLSVFAFAQQPICDGGTCEPNPSSSTYQETIAARPLLPNARGGSSAIVPKSGGSSSNSPQTLPSQNALPGSQSYQYAIPILSLPGRNGLDLNLTLYYNSRVWTVKPASVDPPSPKTITFNADRDWPSYGFRLGFGYLEQVPNSGGYVLTEADGSKRSLAYVATNSYDSTDSSYINYNSSSKVLTYKNGTQVLYEAFPESSTLFRPTKITDTNGNFISITYVSHVTGMNDQQRINTIRDTLDRVISFDYNTNGTLHAVRQGGRYWATFIWGTKPLKYSFATGLSVRDTPALDSPINVLLRCTHWNGGQSGVYYTFEWGDWGIVNQIQQLSSANAVRASVSYNYPLATTALDDAPAYTTQTTDDGSSTVSSTYAVAKVGDLVSTHTVTDPSSARTKITLFTTGDWRDGLVSTVERQNSAGTTLRTVAYDWTADANGARNPRPVRLTTTLNDSGYQSKVEFTYGSYGNVTQASEYDWGLTLKRTTSTTYLATSPYLTRHILDRVTQVLVTGSSNSARTDLFYDGSGLTSVTGAAHHDDAGYPASFLTRGNVTRITRYANAGAGTGPVTRNFSYDSLGNLRTADLDCCNQKTWSYSSLTQYAYPDSITRGPVGTQLTTSATYDFASGNVLSSTDENGQVTGYGYDGMNRLTTLTQPDGVAITTSYDDGAAQATVTRSSTANSAVQVTTLDGAGRVVEQELLDGTSSVSVVDTIYDDINRQVRVSNPLGPGDSQVFTTTQFDELGRTVSVTPPSGGGYQYSYWRNSVTVTDTVIPMSLRRSFTDALGRVVEVDEPGWGDGTPGTGTVTISGSEQRKNEGDPENPIWVYDSGTVSLTVNGLTKTVTYGQGSTASSIASALAAAITADGGYPVYASASAGTVTLTAKTTGYATNYTFTASSTWDTSNWTSPSFTPTTSGLSLTGGQNARVQGAPSLNCPMITTYTYDVLDNLTAVSQAAQPQVSGQPVGGQPRSYTYDSLSRLTAATTPESGTVSTYYTTAGGATCSSDASAVCRRVDARNITSTYSYDGLNRLGSVSYSDGTPTVTYTYGTSSGANNNGRLLSVADGGGSQSYTYDQMGRVLQASNVINGATYPVTYGYNAAGELVSLSYPSGRVVQQSYDGVGRLAQMLSSDSPPYLTVASGDYSAAGQVEHAVYGNGVAGDFSYNSRLQVTSIRYSKPDSPDLLNLTYGYGTRASGQIASITDNLDATRSQSYVYDAWGRISQGTAGNPASPTWKLSWDYDRLGNRRNQNVIGGTGLQVLMSISETTNRINGYGYDAAGNLTSTGSHTYAYDAENRMKAVDGTAATYSYLGALRVKRVSGATTTVYVFSGSKVIAEYANGSLSKEYVYAGSSLLATHAGSATTYSYPDHLSTRVEGDANGNVTRTFGNYPFGETWYETGTASKWKFTSYERDPESGLDYAIFRYDSTNLGRFMSPDPVAGNIASPQSLNRYSYVLNDPVNLVDPLGLYCSPEEEAAEVCRNDDRGGVQPALACGTATIDGYDAGGTCIPRGPRTLDLECDPVFIEAARRAWMRSGNGTQLQEAGFAVTLTNDQVATKDLPNTNEATRITFTPPDNTIAIAHTHPNSKDAVPSPGDRELADRTQSDRPKYTVYTLTNRGLWVYGPGDTKPRKLRENLDWLDPCVRRKDKRGKK